MKNKASNSDYTAIHKDDKGIHILKAKIIDDNYLHFQMLNKTTNILTPVFKIPANYGVLPYLKPNDTQREIEQNLSLTKNVNRRSLIGYYMQFKLIYLINEN